MIRIAEGTVFHIMRYSLHDGPGIRTTVFLKGCPLRCWWCHNPESQRPEPEILYSLGQCRLCGICVDACPQHGLELNDAISQVAACIHCGSCAEACPTEARRLAGRTMKVAEVVAEIERDVVFYDESGGGVTFSGGEPLSQPEFLCALLDACRERRIHTAIETCGAAPSGALLRAARAADLVLYDLKLIDADKHRLYTGAGNRNILDNLALLAAEGLPVVVRVPVIPGVNDTHEDVAALHEFLRPLNIRRVDLLPYHSAGTEKYRRLGLPYRLEGLQPPSEDRLRQIRQQLSGVGLQACPPEGQSL